MSVTLRGTAASVATGTKRFGADLVVIPRGGRAAAEGALIVGEPTQLTMPASTAELVRALPQVGAASAQVYVKTLTDARCCPGEFFLIGFEPETDFALRAWQERGALGSHDAVVGDRVTLREGQTVTFYGTTFTIAGRLDRTGVGIDSTVFLPMAGLREMIAASAELAEEPVTVEPDQISVILVKAAEGVEPTAAAEAISAAVTGIEVVLAPQVIAAAMRDLTGALRLMMLVSLLLWAMLIPILATVFSMAVAERWREIGLWRSLGATRRQVFRLILGEALTITAAGAAAGLGLAVVLLAGFAADAAEATGTPFLWPGWTYALSLGGGLWLAAVVTGGAAAWLPARRAAGLDPYECLRRGGGIG